MSSTLKALGDTLAQAAHHMGSRFSPSGTVIVAVVALSLASAATQTFAASEADGQGVQGTPADHQMSETAQRNVGRAIGAVTGYGLARVFGGGATVKALSTLGGAFVGDRIAKSGVEAKHAQAAQGRAPSAADAVLSRAGRDRPAAGKRMLPDNVAARMDGLVVEAAAARVAAQEQFTIFERAELNAAAAPKDTKAAAEYASARNEFAKSMDGLRVSMSNLSQATRVAGNQGYDVAGYEGAVKEVQSRVDGRTNVYYTNPAIFARAQQIQDSYPHVLGQDDISRMGANGAQRDRSTRMVQR